MRLPKVRLATIVHQRQPEPKNRRFASVLPQLANSLSSRRVLAGGRAFASVVALEVAFTSIPLPQHHSGCTAHVNPCKHVALCSTLSKATHPRGVAAHLKHTYGEVGATPDLIQKPKIS